MFIFYGGEVFTLSPFFYKSVIDTNALTVFIDHVESCIGALLAGGGFAPPSFLGRSAISADV